MLIYFPMKLSFMKYLLHLCLKKKYDEDKNDYINSFRILITNKKIEKLRYEELLIHIDKNYDNKNDLKSEYLKLFLKNDQLILTV